MIWGKILDKFPRLVLPRVFRGRFYYYLPRLVPFMMFLGISSCFFPGIRTDSIVNRNWCAAPCPRTPLMAHPCTPHPLQTSVVCSNPFLKPVEATSLHTRFHLLSILPETYAFTAANKSSLRWFKPSDLHKSKPTYAHSPKFT